MSELTEALAAFPRWMNRPHKRAQVYTWRVAVSMPGDAASNRFRCLPPYRGEFEREQRRAVAQRVREQRRRPLWPGLPVYQERSGEYV